MKDLKNYLDKYKDLSYEMKFVSISDEIWSIGSIEEIKNKISSECFTFHIAVNMIGNWQGEGWYYIFAEGRQLLDYIEDTLDKLGLIELKEAFNNTISLFPSFAKNSDEDTYIDVINFLQNPRFKVNDKRLNDISQEDRKILSSKYHDSINKLDDLSNSIWSYNSDADGWRNILDYIDKLYK